MDKRTKIALVVISVILFLFATYSVGKISGAASFSLLSFLRMSSKPDSATPSALVNCTAPCVCMTKSAFAEAYSYNGVPCGSNISTASNFKVCAYTNGTIENHCLTECSYGCVCASEAYAANNNLTDCSDSKVLCGKAAAGFDRPPVSGYATYTPAGGSGLSSSSGISITKPTPVYLYCYRDRIDISLKPGENAPDDHTAHPASENYTINKMLLLEIKAKQYDTKLRNITLVASGTGNDTYVKNVLVYVTKKDGNVSNTTKLIGESNSSFLADNGTMTFDIIHTVPAGNSSYLLIAYQMNPKAKANSTFMFTITDLGIDSAAEVRVTGLGVKSAVKTIKELPPAEFCGNGIIETDEDCEVGFDGGSFGECESFGFDYGTVGCTLACTFDLSGCYYECDPANVPASNGTWTDCENGTRDYIVYGCNKETGDWISQVSETEDCGGLGIWLWVLVGVGGLLVLAGIGFAIWYFVFRQAAATAAGSAASTSSAKPSGSKPPTTPNKAPAAKNQKAAAK